MYLCIQVLRWAVSVSSLLLWLLSSSSVLFTSLKCSMLARSAEVLGCWVVSQSTKQACPKDQDTDYGRALQSCWKVIWSKIWTFLEKADPCVICMSHWNGEGRSVSLLQVTFAGSQFALSEYSIGMLRTKPNAKALEGLLKKHFCRGWVW